MGKENIVKPAASNLEGTICILSFLHFIYYETLVYPDGNATFAKNRKAVVKEAMEKGRLLSQFKCMRKIFIKQPLLIWTVSSAAVLEVPASILV